MQRYESYKPSGIPWVGDIPSHWGVKKNKFLLSERKAVVGKDAPNFKLLSLTLQGVILRDMENPKGKFPAEFDTYKQVSPDDLIFCLFDVEETPRTVGLAKHHGMITGAYTVTRCNEQVSSAFLYYYYLSLDEGKQLRSLYTGLRNVITRDTFFSLATPFPPREEQDRIVAFLDQKTADIDAAIAKKERLIELLQEQKKAAIRRAVTLGINENHRLLPHDLSYLKQVPSNWSIKRNKQLFFEKKGVVGKQAPSYTLLSLTLNGVIPRDLDNPKGKFPAEFDTYKKVQPNDMVFCLFDVEETPRTVGLARHVGMITGAYTVVECFDPSLAGYLSYFYTALDDEKMLRPFYTGLRNVIQRNTFFGLQVPIPPENERQEIVEYIDSVIHDTAQLAEKAKQEVISLQEFKNTLVASAVTGRIKV